MTGATADTACSLTSRNDLSGSTSWLNSASAHLRNRPRSETGMPSSSAMTITGSG